MNTEQNKIGQRAHLVDFTENSEFSIAVQTVATELAWTNEKQRQRERQMAESAAMKAARRKLFTTD